MSPVTPPSEVLLYLSGCMNKLIFTEEFCQPENLYPFTLTRQLQDIRVGILTIREKWELLTGWPSFDKKEDDYKDLERSVHMDEAVGEGACYMIHGNLLPTRKLVKAMKKLQHGEFLVNSSGTGLVYCFTRNRIIDRHRIKVGKAVLWEEPLLTIQYPWDIFQLNDPALRLDFEYLTAKRKSAPVPRSNRVIKPSQVFLEKGARVEHCIINASEGPVYIGKNAELMEGSMIRGPFAMGENSCLKMGTKVYGATSLGPGCIAGGEIKNSVFFGYSNKAHDGYLGDSVLGEWCNLGAGTTNSNLKNNARDVRIWTPKGELPAGKKCGVFMGDYSRTVVNTSINTGTVIGVCCHVAGQGLTPKYIPSFSWGSEGVEKYDLEKAVQDISGWMALKGRSPGESQLSILRSVYEKF